MCVYEAKVSLLEPAFLLLGLQHYAIAQADQFCAQTLKALLRGNIVHLYHRTKLALPGYALNFVKIEADTLRPKAPLGVLRIQLNGYFPDGNAGVLNANVANGGVVFLDDARTPPGAKPR